MSESGRERIGLAEIFRQNAAVPLPAMLNRIYRVGRYTVMKKIFRKMMLAGEVSAKKKKGNKQGADVPGGSLPGTGNIQKVWN